jgi:hypothetical protein
VGWGVYGPGYLSRRPRHRVNKDDLFAGYQGKAIVIESGHTRLYAFRHRVNFTEASYGQSDT